MEVIDASAFFAALLRPRRALRRRSALSAQAAAAIDVTQMKHVTVCISSHMDADEAGQSIRQVRSGSQLQGNTPKTRLCA